MRDEPHKRQVVFLEDGFTVTWADRTRRAIEPPPTLQQMLEDKVEEHGANRVAQAVGLAWHTVDKLRKGDVTNGGTVMTVWVRRPELARLDRQADARREAERETDAGERAKRDALRDAADDARREATGHR